MTTLTLIRPNLHRVDSAGRQMLFHVPSSSLFELDGAARDVLALFDEHATLDAASLAERLGGRHDALAAARDGGRAAPAPRARRARRGRPHQSAARAR
jgi:hypothetical protein